ncbi:MAG: hypothetical protein ACJA0U_003409 [Salibacteraceae bacterium]|jgi:hypothetical protein
MKIVNLIFFLFFITQVSGQAIYKSYDKPTFKGLLEKGLTFIATGDSIADSVYFSTMKKNWNATPVEFKEATDTAKVKVAQFSIVEVRLESNKVYTLIDVRWVAISSGFSKYSCVGYLHANGFSQSTSEDNKSLYFDLVVSSFNKIVSEIDDNKISKMGTGLYKKIHKTILPDSKVLKKKTLLIIGKTKERIDLEALKEAKIKYELMTESEYSELEEEDKSKYCLMYFAMNSFTDIAMFNLENNELIYSRHFASVKKKFSSSDIKEMKKTWSE